MELSHDWREFQAVFHPTRKRGSQASALEPNWLAVITDAGNILAVAGDIEGGWEGRPVEELKAAYSKRAIQVFDRQDVDRWMQASLALPHFYDQTEYLRSQTSAQSLTTHFLLQAVRGWWGKILPSAYGIFFRITGAAGSQPRELFVLVRRGKVELFHTPDYNSLSIDRARDPEAVVRYLSEKHIVPVQGMVVSEADWEEWTLRSLSHSEAWRKLCFAVQSGQAQLAPFRWRLMALASSRAFLGI